jgi:hypothetical protein
MFVTIDANEYGHVAASLEVQRDLSPAFVVHNMMNDQVFVYDQQAEINPKTVEEMLVDILQGKAEPGVQGVKDQEGKEKEERKVSDDGHDEL